VASALAPLLEKFHGVRPVIPRVHEDSNALNKAYHDVRTRPFGWSDAGYPVAIFLPENEAEVAGLVAALFAKRALLDRHGVKVSVCGGCHTSKSMASGCVTIDLQKIAHAVPDFDQRRIRVGGGAKLKEPINALHGSGFAIATGTHTDTGVGGLTLAGGIGFLSPRCGLACDTIVRARVVLCDGRVVECTDNNEHKDLMRALRGGGGNFGIVSEFEFEIFETAHTFAGAVLAYPSSAASWKQTVQSWADAVATLPPSDFSLLAMDSTGLPVMPLLCTSVGGPSHKKSDAVVFKRMKAMKGPRMSPGFFVAMDFHKTLMRLSEPLVLPSFYRAQGWCIGAVSDALLDALYKLTHVRPALPMGSGVVLAPYLHVAKTGVAGRPHAMGHRDKSFWLFCEARWYKSCDEERCIKWLALVMDAVKQAGITATTSHAGNAGEENSDDFAYAVPVKEFLAKTKDVYDGTNFWSCNANVVPWSMRAVA